MQKLILLTGGTGFFGRALLRHILAQGIPIDTTIWLLTRDPWRFQSIYPSLVDSDRIRLVSGDILNFPILQLDIQFTHILHAATDSTLGPKLTPLQRYQQIVDGTTNILDLAAKCRGCRLLYISSGGIYGAQPADLSAIPEEWLGSPVLDDATTAYSQGKRAAEHLCTLYRDSFGLNVFVARCFTFVGQDLPLDAHFAIGNFIRDALYSPEILVKGDGRSVRTYLDQRDLANWLWTLLEHGIDGEVYNIGSDRCISIGELAYLVRDLLCPTKPVKIQNCLQQQTSRNRYVPSIDKIKRLHNLTPIVALEDAICYTASCMFNSAKQLNPS